MLTGKESESLHFLGVWGGASMAMDKIMGEKRQVLPYTQTAAFLNRNVAITTKRKRKQCSALVIHSNGVDEPVGFSELVCIVLDKIDT